MAQLEMDMKNIASHVTLEVKIKHVTAWRWRVKLGLWLIRLAGLVMWINIEVIEDA